MCADVSAKTNAMLKKKKKKKIEQVSNCNSCSLTSRLVAPWCGGFFV